MLTARDLPNDTEALKRMVVSQQAQLADRDHEIERLRLLIAKLRRMQFGRGSEKLDAQIHELELVLEDLETNLAARAITASATILETKPISVRRPLPGSCHARRGSTNHSACATSAAGR